MGKSSLLSVLLSIVACRPTSRTFMHEATHCISACAGLPGAVPLVAVRDAILIDPLSSVLPNEPLGVWVVTVVASVFLAAATDTFSATGGATWLRCVIAGRRSAVSVTASLLLILR